MVNDNCGKKKEEKVGYHSPSFQFSKPPKIFLVH